MCDRMPADAGPPAPLMHCRRHPLRWAARSRLPCFVPRATRALYIKASHGCCSGKCCGGASGQARVGGERCQLRVVDSGRASTGPSGMAGPAAQAR